MKTPHVIGLVVVSVLVTLAIEETRIAGLRKSVDRDESPSVAAATATPSRTDGMASPPPVTKKIRPAARQDGTAADSEAAGKSEDSSLAGTARKMWENPAGKSMMNQGVKIAVAMMYEDFIGGLDLSPEESDYFKELLGGDMASQQEIGMKLMGATAGERKELMEEMARHEKENTEAIRKFLNNEEDFKKFTEYKERLPERQQLDGLRSAMSAKGVPLDAELESELVDAMYRVRTTSNGVDFSGNQGFEEIAKGDAVARFEEGWEKQQQALREETAKILNPEQLSTFLEYQKQMKDMQIMGLKMAEKMMADPKSEPE